MTEEQFSELRDYSDGQPISKGYEPSSALVRNGWLRREIDDFYRITPQGKWVLKAVKEGTVGLR